MTVKARKKAAMSSAEASHVASGRSPSSLQDEARFVMDQDGRLIHVTKPFASLIKKSPDKATGQDLSSFVEFTEPDESFRCHNLFGPASVSYIDTLCEGLHKVHFPGRKTPALIQLDRVEGQDGTHFMIGVVAASRAGKVALDAVTTEDDHKAASRFLKLVEKQTQEKPASAKEKGKISARSDQGELTNFLNMSNDVMAVCALDGSFSRVNSRFNEILGYSDDELRTMNFMDLIYPDDRPYVRTSLHGLIHEEECEGRLIDFEARVVGKTGEQRWVSWRQKRSGQILYVVGQDVTAVKQDEVALKRQKEQLREAQAIGRMGHWYWKVGEEKFELSDQIYRIFGVSKATFDPTMESINGLLYKRDLGRLMQTFQRVIIEQNEYDIDFRIKRPDGETRYIRCQGRCEKDEEGDVIALFGIMQDVTARHIYEEELRAAKENVERAYAAKSQFLANMSHELRTPLNAIIGFSEMMQRELLGPIGTEKYFEYIAGIRQSGEHLLDLISDILDMSKIEAGKYELDLEEFNLAKVIRLATHMMEGRALDSRIKISVSIDDEGLNVIADRRAVMQILLNLLSNAVKFTEPGGAVKVNCVGRKDYISIKVIDTGIGIPMNRLKDITRPFEQAASHYAREHEGTGLGLSITKELAEMHGGLLNIVSTVGVGTTVTVRLPYNAYPHMRKKKSGKKAIEASRVAAT